MPDVLRYYATLRFENCATVTIEYAKDTSGGELDLDELFWATDEWCTACLRKCRYRSFAEDEEFRSHLTKLDIEGLDVLPPPYSDDIMMVYVPIPFVEMSAQNVRIESYENKHVKAFIAPVYLERSPEHGLWISERVVHGKLGEKTKYVSGLHLSVQEQQWEDRVREHWNE